MIVEITLAVNGQAGTEVTMMLHRGQLKCISIQLHLACFNRANENIASNRKQRTYSKLARSIMPLTNRTWTSYYLIWGYNR